MQQRSFWVWLLAGVAAATLGWMIGGWFGAFLPRTLGAAVLVAFSCGWLGGSLRRGLVAGALAGTVAAAAYLLGARLVTPVFAWPAASLAIGFAVAGLLRRPWVRVLAVMTAPIFGLVGFVLGGVGMAFLGMSLNSGQVLGQLLLGGAAGFGAATLVGLHLTARWFDRPLTAVQPAAVSEVIA